MPTASTMATMATIALSAWCVGGSVFLAWMAFRPRGHRVPCGDCGLTYERRGDRDTCPHCRTSACPDCGLICDLAYGCPHCGYAGAGRPRLPRNPRFRARPLAPRARGTRRRKAVPRSGRR
jgi:hypothetical protein